MGHPLRLAGLTRLEVYRIHDPRFPALSGFGAARWGGRWNPPGVAVVYTSAAYEGTLLEILARLEIGTIPTGHVASRIVLPENATVQTFDETGHADWRRRRRSHDVGREWVDSGRTLALVVPSLVARPWGRNVVLNPAHPDFARVRVAEVVDVRWDPRLY
ncbi:MAG: RES domain-containing protein [Gemmatimonadetes bacterium]|nr:RES domain-containing protein [Gemmatimonadota bacterium]